MVAKMIGTGEVIGALSLLIRPAFSVLTLLLLWKVASELFYPHYEFFEWVERGGSYGVLLALWFIYKRPALRRPVFALFL